MSGTNREDGHRPPPILEPDAHGQAALILTESLIHMLVEQDALTLLQAVEVIETAANVKFDVATAAGETKTRMRASLALLARIQTSFEVDIGDLVPERTPI